MRRLARLLAAFSILLSLQATTSAVTIMKNVGHGDCYVVLSDGRVVVIDAGPAGTSNGLVSFLKSGLLHYDRIVITHVHSDHVGGLLTAEQYARQSESHLSTDLLVSNHGEHDLSLVINETRLRPLLQAMKARKPVVALSDEGIAKLSLADPAIEVRLVTLPSTSGNSENRTGLAVKVTEIRDGTRRAVLFLGDIEQQEQELLLKHEQAAEIFADVRAVTVPHHGRPTTLSAGFFQGVRREAGEGVVLLHSDSHPLDPELRQRATDAGLRVLSTADSALGGKDVYFDPFESPSESPSYLTITGKPASIRSFVASHRQDFGLVVRGELSAGEMADAISAYSARAASSLLAVGTPISLPTDAWTKSHFETKLQALRTETDTLIKDLRSSDEKIVKRAAVKLAARAQKLTSEQLQEVVQIMRDNAESWRTDMGHPPDCPHKTIYNERSVKYYAGTVVARAGAAEPKVRTEARQALKEGKTTSIVDDPHWI